jgi:hypothetical protein
MWSVTFSPQHLFFDYLRAVSGSNGKISPGDGGQNRFIALSINDSLAGARMLAPQGRAWGSLRSIA